MREETMKALQARDEIIAALGMLEDEEERRKAKREELQENLKAVLKTIREDDDLAEATGKRRRKAVEPAKKRGAKGE